MYILFQNIAIATWIQSLCGGLCNAEDGLEEVFKYLLPNCDNRPNQHLKRGISAERSSGRIQDGALRCLSYGYQEEQIHQSRGRPRNRDREHRFLLKTRSSETSRSRSRSPVRIGEEEDIRNNVYDPQNPRSGAERWNSLLRHPDRYVVRPEQLHVYFECHKPDVMILHHTVVPDPDYHGYNRFEYQAKVVIEISSYKKGATTLTTHIDKSVEQCVQSCLAALAYDQDLMYGLVVVVDGFVLIKVQKQNQGGQEEYNISETDLIMWDNQDSLYALFYTLDKYLEDDDPHPDIDNL